MNGFFLVPEISREWILANRPHWQPPEQLVMRENEELQTSCDVWSFGMIVLQVCRVRSQFMWFVSLRWRFDFLVQVFSGSIPYHHLHNPALVTLSIVQGVLPQRPECIDNELWRILENCWKHNPHDRPSMQVISPWIRLVRELQRFGS